MSKPGDKVEFGGIKATVVSDAEAEKVDYVVCMPEGPSEFTDNLTGFCSHCGRKVMFRWHAPLKPKKICIDCAAKLPGARRKVTGEHE